MPASQFPAPRWVHELSSAVLTLSSFQVPDCRPYPQGAGVVAAGVSVTEAQPHLGSFARVGQIWSFSPQAVLIYFTAGEARGFV